MFIRNRSDPPLENIKTPCHSCMLPSQAWAQALARIYINKQIPD